MNKHATESGGQTSWLDADDIKSRVSIEAVLAKYGILERLKRKGERLLGLSPFRDEKSPSFSVDTRKNIWNDFGGKPEVPGNVIGLVQALEKCSFREALVILHRDFIGGVLDTPPCDEKCASTDHEPVKQQPAPPPEREIQENIPFGKELKGLRFEVPLMQDKGISAETCKQFGAGYCTSGLMKGRVVFPIRNTKGEIMSYAGRAVKKTDEEENGKYRFPPKFNKSLELFNIDRIANDTETKKAVKDFGIILVEGFTDALKLSQEGFLNVVALMGTDFHEAQKRMLLDPKLNPTRRITLFLDNDEAGQNGKRKIAAECIHNGFVRYVDWTHAPDGKSEPEHFCRDELIALLGL
jgi:DNA primase